MRTRGEAIQPAQTSNLPYVGLEHIDSGDPNLTRWGVTSEVTSAKSRFYQRDVLYGKLRPYLDKAVLAEFDGICSTDILVFVAGTAIAPEFLSYFVHSTHFVDEAVRSTGGVNLPRTSWSSLAACEFMLPPLAEQRAIARALRAVQEAIQARRRELALERERKAALMEQLFTKGTRGEPTRQTEIGEIPESWQVMKLRDVFDLLLDHRGITPKKLGGDFAATGIQVISAMNVGNGQLSLTRNVRYISEEMYDRWMAEELQRDDVLLTSEAPLGEVALIGTNNRICLGQRLFALRANQSLIKPHFLYHQLRSEGMQRRIQAKASGTTALGIKQAELVKLYIEVPQLEEQLLICSILDANDQKMWILKRELTFLDELFRAMLEELITGQLSARPLIDADETGATDA